MRLGRIAPLGAVVLWLSGCATSEAHWRSHVSALPTQAPMVLLGEQHDADEHQTLARLSVARLAQSTGLSALLLEMADDGTDTTGLASDATEAQVRERLRWNDAGWPWQRYGPVVMQAVRLGVPVVGANLPRPAMGSVMRDEQWDARVPAEVLADHRERMVGSHCGLLPESQVPGMARIQIARDARMAQTAERWLRPAKRCCWWRGRNTSNATVASRCFGRRPCLSQPMWFGCARAQPRPTPAVWPMPPGPRPPRLSATIAPRWRGRANEIRRCV